MTKQVVLLVQDDTPTRKYIERLGFDVEIGLEVYKDKHVAVFFPGVGMSDVDPALYGQDRSPFVTCIDPQYDAKCLEVMHQAADYDIPMIGICRGGQLLNVFNGGSLIQHLPGHIGNHHSVVCEDGVLRTVNSSHHQAMIPAACCFVPLMLDIEHGIHEMLYYPETHALCIQCHPEWPGMPEDGLGYINYLIKAVVGGKDVA